MARRSGWVARSGGVGLLALAMLAVGVSFLWLRVTLPGEPAQVPADAWDWSAEGVVVVPIGSGPGPFLAGDRVAAVDGVTVEALADAAVDPRRPEASPAGGLPAGVTRFTVARAGTVQELDVELAVQPVGGTLASADPAARVHRRPGVRRPARLAAPAHRGLAPRVPARLVRQPRQRADLGGRPPPDGPRPTRAHAAAVRDRRLAAPRVLVVDRPRARALAHPGDGPPRLARVRRRRVRGPAGGVRGAASW